MYTAKTLSDFIKSPADPPCRPNEAPNSDLLLLKYEEEPEPEPTCCFGCQKKTRIRNLPFPQDRILTIVGSPVVKGEKGTNKAVVQFIPVIDQPASSNRYYVVVAKGSKRGKVYRCSKEGIACCSCLGAKDAKPRAFDHRDIYQQMEIVCDKKLGKFAAKSVASDGHPPWLLGRKHWEVYASKPKNCTLTEASGIDSLLRPCLPDFNFPIAATDHVPKITVGRWYCPFMFAKEAACSLRSQMRRSMFYEITLEQFWQEVYACENQTGRNRVVEVNALFGTLLVMLDGKELVQDIVRRNDGMIWFKPFDSKAEGIGLSSALWERMRSVQRRGGWIDDDEEERMVRLEEHGGEYWHKFACFVLVERFVLKRMDGSLVMTFDFRHGIKVRSKWE